MRKSERERKNKLDIVFQESRRKMSSIWHSFNSQVVDKQLSPSLPTGNFYFCLHEM